MYLQDQAKEVISSLTQSSPLPPHKGGREWDLVKKAIISGSPPLEIKRRVVAAYEAEYDKAASKVILDDGVRLIIKEMNNFPHSVNYEDYIGKFFIKVRHDLAIKGINSVFSEIALLSACRAILERSVDRNFCFSLNFSVDIMDYIVSRDLPMIIGGYGLANLNSLELFLAQVRSDFSQELKNSPFKESIKRLRRFFQNNS